MDLGDLELAMLRRQMLNDTSSTPSTSSFSGLSASANTALVEVTVASNVTGSKYKPREQFLALHLFSVIS
jgi:hypothetical protein